MAISGSMVEAEGAGLKEAMYYLTTVQGVSSTVQWGLDFQIYLK